MLGKRRIITSTIRTRVNHRRLQPQADSEGNERFRRGVLAAEPYPPIKRREKGSLTAAAAACSPLRGIFVFGTLFDVIAKCAL